MARCWIDTGDDNALNRAVTDGHLLPEDADAIPEFRHELADSAAKRRAAEEGGEPS